MVSNSQCPPDMFLEPHFVVCTSCEHVCHERYQTPHDCQTHCPDYLLKSTTRRPVLSTTKSALAVTPLRIDMAAIVIVIFVLIILLFIILLVYCAVTFAKTGHIISKGVHKYNHASMQKYKNTKMPIVDMKNDQTQKTGLTNVEAGREHGSRLYRFGADQHVTSYISRHPTPTIVVEDHTDDYSVDLSQETPVIPRDIPNNSLLSRRHEQHCMSRIHVPNANLTTRNSEFLSTHGRDTRRSLDSGKGSSDTSTQTRGSMSSISPSITRNHETYVTGTSFSRPWPETNVSRLVDKQNNRHMQERPENQNGPLVCQETHTNYVYNGASMGIDNSLRFIPCDAEANTNNFAGNTSVGQNGIRKTRAVLDGNVTSIQVGQTLAGLNAWETSGPGIFPPDSLKQDEPVRVASTLQSIELQGPANERQHCDDNAADNFTDSGSQSLSIDLRLSVTDERPGSAQPRSGGACSDNDTQSGSKWENVMRVYELVNGELYKYPWIVGCMLSNDVLEILINLKDVNLDTSEAYDQLCGAIPPDLRQYLMFSEEGPSFVLSCSNQPIHAPGAQEYRTSVQEATSSVGKPDVALCAVLDTS